MATLGLAATVAAIGRTGVVRSPDPGSGFKFTAEALRPTWPIEYPYGQKYKNWINTSADTLQGRACFLYSSLPIFAKLYPVAMPVLVSLGE